MVDTRWELAQVQSAHDRTDSWGPRATRKPQAGLVAADGFAGARHRGKFGAGVHQQGRALKLAVIVALWAAVVAAFVSFIYRRQADIDQAKSRDLKLVYDLQLDREISARREYELSIETQLRRELAIGDARSGVRRGGQSPGGTRSAARESRDHLRHRSAEQARNRDRKHDRAPVWGLGRGTAGAPASDRSVSPGRVISSRIDAEATAGPEDFDPNTEESPIIDVPAEPQPPDDEWAPQVPAGAHRRPSEREPADSGWRPAPPEQPRQEGSRRAPEAAAAPNLNLRRRLTPGCRGCRSTSRRRHRLRRARSRAPSPPRAGTRRQTCADGIRLAACARPGAVHPGRRTWQQLVVSGHGERCVDTRGPGEPPFVAPPPPVSPVTPADAGDDAPAHRIGAARAPLHGGDGRSRVREARPSLGSP